jgi:hypothetical protein
MTPLTRQFFEISHVLDAAECSETLDGIVCQQRFIILPCNFKVLLGSSNSKYTLHMDLSVLVQPEIWPLPCQKLSVYNIHQGDVNRNRLAGIRTVSILSIVTR